MSGDPTTRGAERPTIDLSVVIPAYNEEERLKRAIPEIAQHLRASKRSFEIIVVDDGSQDGTSAITKKLAESLPGLQLISYRPNRGKGGAVRAGMLAAVGDCVLFSDADQSTPIGELDALLAKIEHGGYDMAIGSRAIAGAEVEETQGWHRVLAAKLFGGASKLLAVRGIADTQCGFKCMTREVAQKVFPQVTSDTAIFDIEMLAVAAREGYRIAELPVTWVHDQDTRIPYDLRRALRIWGELFRIRRAQKIGWPLKANTQPRRSAS